MHTWAVQWNLLNDNQIRLVSNAIQACGSHLVHVEVPAFSTEIVGDHGIEGTNVIPYGSNSMMKAAQKLAWDGLFFSEYNFRTDQWIQNRDDMLNRDAHGMTISRLITDFDDYVRGLREVEDPDPQQKKRWENYLEKDYFIRPRDDTKYFTGVCVKGRDIPNHFRHYDKSVRVSLASSKEIDMEWRYFVVGGKIIDGSIYKFEDRPFFKHETDRDVLEEAQTFADQWLPHETCVMDLALNKGKLKVVEFNCINSTGFYNHDIPKVIAAIDYYYRNWDNF